MKDKPSNRRWILIALILVVVIFLAYVIDLQGLIDALRDVKLEPLVFGALAIIPGLILISVRWRYLLGNQVPFSASFNSDSISYMIRMFTPVYVPVLRVATIAMTTPLTVSQATPSMMAERLLELIMRVIALVLAAILISTSGIAPIWIIFWILVLALFIVGVVRFSTNASTYMPRLITWLARLPRMDKERLEGPMTSLGEGMSTVGTTRRLVLSLLLSLLMWGLFWIGFAVLFEAAGIDVDLKEALALSAAILVVLPPSTPAMIGVYQGVMVALLLPFQVGNANSMLAYSILAFGVQVIFWVLAGLWGLSRTRLNVRELVKLRGFKQDDATELKDQGGGGGDNGI